MEYNDTELENYLTSLGNNDEFTVLVKGVRLDFDATMWASHPRVELFLERIDAIKASLKYLPVTIKEDLLRELDAVYLENLDENLKIEFQEFKDYVSKLLDAEIKREQKKKHEIVRYEYYSREDGTVVRVSLETGAIEVVKRPGEPMDSKFLEEIEDEEPQREPFTGCCIVMHTLLLSTYGLRSEEYSRMLGIISSLETDEYCTILYYYGLDGKGRRSMEEVAKEMTTTLKKVKGRYNSGFRKIKNMYNERSFYSIVRELRH